MNPQKKQRTIQKPNKFCFRSRKYNERKGCDEASLFYLDFCDMWAGGVLLLLSYKQFIQSNKKSQKKETYKKTNKLGYFR